MAFNCKIEELSRGGRRWSKKKVHMDAHGTGELKAHDLVL
jgi:hypothetical protein